MAWVFWQAQLGTSLAMPVSLYGEHPRTCDATGDSLNLVLQLRGFEAWSKKSATFAANCIVQFINPILAIMRCHTIRVQDAAWMQSDSVFMMACQVPVSQVWFRWDSLGKRNQVLGDMVGKPWTRSAIALTKKQSMFLMAVGFPLVVLLVWVSDTSDITKGM